MTYQFKIKLKGISKPPVWRRILISEQATFFDLHKAIQGAFGWHEYHLFRFSEKAYGGNIHICEPDSYEGMCRNSNPTDAKKIALNQVFNEDCRHLVYLYDFGDDWVHDILLEEISEENIEKAVCTAGKGACPPEDCGGPMGYEMMKELFLSAPKSREANRYRKWLCLGKGEAWDAARFNLTEANAYMEEIYGEQERLLCSIPHEIIKRIADELECGMICFLNPDTHEYVSIMGDSYMEHDRELEKEVLDEVEQWNRSIRIEPMESSDAFRVMSSFIESPYSGNDLRMKSRLLNAISGPKPFQHFKNLIEVSPYRQQWFEYRHLAMEEYVKEQII